MKTEQKRSKEWRRRESLEAAVDLCGPQDPGCQRRAILNHVDNPSSLTRFFSSSTSLVFSLPSVCVLLVAVATSVLAALSRIEELDFDHKAGDVTARARNMCFTCV